MPPAPAHIGPAEPPWRIALTLLLEDIGDAGPPPASEAMAALRASSSARLDELAHRVLEGEPAGADAAQIPFLAAALQAAWTRLAAALGAPRVAPLDTPGLCPCCGSLPVASVVRTSPEAGNLRYLHCSLCNTQWNLVRVRCTHCLANARIAYRHLEAPGATAPPPMRAETCEDCMGYTKILYLEAAPQADPVADDLATLALDLLLDESGYARNGPNPLLVPGG